MRYLKNRKVAIFGSGGIKPSSPDWIRAFQVGRLLAESGFTVVNGGYRGVMEASAFGAKSGGGPVIGVTAKVFKSKRNPYIDTEIQETNLTNRLAKLIDISDGYLILDGGTGTLAELVTVWELLSKGFSSKPAVVLGCGMQQVVRFISRLPEVNVPPQLKLFTDATRAVRYLKKQMVSA